MVCRSQGLHLTPRSPRLDSRWEQFGQDSFTKQKEESEEEDGEEEEEKPTHTASCMFEKNHDCYRLKILHRYCYLSYHGRSGNFERA